jgi:hypothetical protein
MEARTCRKLLLRQPSCLAQRPYGSTQRLVVRRNPSLLAGAHGCAPQPSARPPPLRARCERSWQCYL